MLSGSAFSWIVDSDNGKESAGGRWSIVEVLFERKSRKRRAGWRHARIECGSLRHCDVGHRSSPTDPIAIHVLPHNLH
jgi:hypothetical protein